MIQHLDVSEGKQPVLAENWYHQVPIWISTLGNHFINGVLKVIQFGYADDTKLSGTKQFLRDNKGHVYSMWEPGKAPIDVIMRYRLGEHDLLEDDIHAPAGYDQDQR